MWRFVVLIVTVALWAWAFALMVLATTAHLLILADWSLLLGLVAAVLSGAVLVEVERRRVHEVAELLMSKAREHPGVSRLSEVRGDDDRR